MFMQIFRLAEYFSNTKISPVHEETEKNIAFGEVRDEGLRGHWVTGVLVL